MTSNTPETEQSKSLRPIGIASCDGGSDTHQFILVRDVAHHPYPIELRCELCGYTAMVSYRKWSWILSQYLREHTAALEAAKREAREEIDQALELLFEHSAMPQQLSPSGYTHPPQRNYGEGYQQAIKDARAQLSHPNQPKQGGGGE